MRFFLSSFVIVAVVHISLSFRCGVLFDVGIIIRFFHSSNLNAHVNKQCFECNFMWFLVFIRRNGKLYHFKETSKMNRILYVCTFLFSLHSLFLLSVPLHFNESLCDRFCQAECLLER